MVIERFNSDTPDHSWRPPHDRAGSFETSERQTPVAPATRPEGKRARRRRKKSADDGSSAVVTEAAKPSSDASPENKTDVEKIPPLLGEGVIWQSDTPEKPESDEKRASKSEASEAVVLSRREKPLTPQEAFLLQQELQRETAEAATLIEPIISRYEQQPQQQQLTQEEVGDQESKLEIVSAVEIEKSAETKEAADGSAITRPGEADTPPDMPPPVLPPDPVLFEGRMQAHGDLAADPIGLQQSMDVLPATHDYEAPEPMPRSSGMYESVTPPGLQRTTADVSRAAWTGAMAGWWAGRRGKRKAVEQAHRAGVAEGRAAAGRLEAEPLHPYVSAEGDRATVMPLSVETRPMDKPAEVLAPVAASVAALERLRPSLRPSQEAPAPAQAAAKRATERLVDSDSMKSREQPAAVPGTRSEKSMPKRELLKAAKDIKIEGVSLKDIYDAKRIDEEGMRAVVGAYLRGGSVSEQLSKEITAKEMSFERDPLFRHNHRSREALERAGERVGKVFNRGISAASEVAGERGAQFALSAQRTAHKAGQVVASGAKQAQHDLVDNGNSADWYGITAIVVVWSIILLLIMT